jgi:peptidoglycan/xylan/chitin deacetylase (PgdA/CDA1 family)
LAAALAAGAAAAECGDSPGDRPVYLTFDTGAMETAPRVAEVLNRQNVKATFFLADEPTRSGGTALDDTWSPWWQARAAEGHAFGSLTFAHAYWVSDTPAGFRIRPGAGKVVNWSADQYCADLQRSAERFHAMTGRTMAKVFRAPGGKTSAKLIDSANACGWVHAGWSGAGALGDGLRSSLGDEPRSARYANARLLERTLRDIRPGDVLRAHLGAGSRRDPWATADLEPLIVGLKANGLCFATLRSHPAYRAQFSW